MARGVWMSDHSLDELNFRCAMCHEWLLFDHLAFTFVVNEDPIEREGVCGFCVASQEC